MFGYNPCFGGGYPHGYEIGINIPRMIIENINGKVNKNVVRKYEEDTYMMKFSEIKIISRHHDSR